MGNESGKPEDPQDPKTSPSLKKGASQPEDIRDKYILGDVLGSGSFGQVREAKLRKSPDRIRAVKIIERDDATNQTEWSNSRMFRAEVALLQNLKHENIVRFWDVYEDVHFLYVVMDLCRGGEVFSMILSLKRFTEANAATLGAQMLTSIDYIHKKGVMHRDIKAENFLLHEKSPTSCLKMIDFGMATKFEHGQWFTDICGSPHYLAPELIGQKYNHMVDVWACGVTMYLMMYGAYPYDAKNTKEIMMKVLTDPIKWQQKVKLGSNPLNFLKKILQPNLQKRYSAEAALQHAFILKAHEHDPELGREADPEEADPEELAAAVRSAHKKMTQAKKTLDPEAIKRRNERLETIDAKFRQGIRLGARLGETPKEDLEARPEFVRRANKLTTAPSAAVAAAVRAASRVAAKVTTPKPRAVRIADEVSRVNVEEEEEEENLPVARRNNERTKTDRYMYIGELNVAEEEKLKNIWSQWKSDLCNEEEREGQVSPRESVQNGHDKKAADLSMPQASGQSADDKRKKQDELSAASSKNEADKDREAKSSLKKKPRAKATAAGSKKQENFGGVIPGGAPALPGQTSPRGAALVEGG
eukprot:TRINITY_DN1735_c2_g1_i2.p1 TRINITY_DN1735_c2_g1~~TRINITY_DN1735_c2_g1_i2.p1  ORF type:complete len:587 (-),score=146.09 TRINITY_DN1735_c2_g1_i2:490-2250(-)